MLGMLFGIAAVGFAILAFGITRTLASEQTENAFLALLGVSWLILYEVFLLATTPLVRRYGQLLAHRVCRPR